MPPKARNASGRKAVAAEEAPVASPLKRGRAPKADAVAAAVEPPKKRGRPPKAKAEEPVVEDAPEPKVRGRKPNIAPGPEPVVEAPAVKRSRGRPRKETLPVQEEALVKSRRGRPSKAAVTSEATPKHGRPPRTATLDLNRVAGSPRVSKRSSPRTKAKDESAARRLDPRMRPKLRTRLPSAKITKPKSVPESVPKPTARRGRPPKNAALAPKQAAVAKPAKLAKPLAPRKVRGHTLRQIPDQYVAQVDQYLQELIEATASPMEEEQVEEAQQEDGSAAEDAAEDGPDVLPSSEKDRNQYQEYSDNNGDVEMDGQQDGAEDEEDMQAVVAQQDEEDDERANNELPQGDAENSELHENVEPVHQISMSIQEDVEVERDEHGNVHAEVDTEIVVREDDSDDDQDIFNGAEHDGLISGTPGPPATAIFS